MAKIKITHSGDYEDKIFIDGGKEKYDTIEDILKDLYRNNMSQRTLSEYGTVQCFECCNRSIIDLFQIVNTYIPNTPIEDVVREIIKIKFENPLSGEIKRLYPGFCGDIERANLFLVPEQKYFEKATGDYHPFLSWEDLGKGIGDDLDEEGEFFDSWLNYFEAAGITKEDYKSMFKTI